jgi:hypothetical protein
MLESVMWRTQRRGLFLEVSEYQQLSHGAITPQYFFVSNPGHIREQHITAEFQFFKAQTDFPNITYLLTYLFTELSPS